jgi:hypothetical protein
MEIYIRTELYAPLSGEEMQYFYRRNAPTIFVFFHTPNTRSPGPFLEINFGQSAFNLDIHYQALYSHNRFIRNAAQSYKGRDFIHNHSYMGCNPARRSHN